MFTITNSPIQIFDLVLTSMEHVGGIVTFEGRVRNSNQGKSVLKLEYEAFKEMAELEGNKIIKEARELFDIVDVACVHRTGILEIKDLAVWIVAYSKHREAAFRATEYVIDQLKTRVPIWKKEYYVNGETDWVKCLACAAKGIPHHEHFHHR